MQSAKSIRIPQSEIRNPWKGFSFRIPHSAFRNSLRGFTLIEILVALAIFSIIIAALYGTFFLSHKAVDALDDSLIRLQEARAFVDTLKREMESAFYETGAGKKYALFKVDDRDFYGRQASQVDFTAFSPLLPGVARIMYTVEEDKDRLVLRKKIASAYGKPDETKSFGLMEDIESFTVEAKHEGKWVKTWDSGLTKRLPEEIRISLKIGAKRRGEGERGQGETSVFTVSDIARPRIEKAL